MVVSNLFQVRKTKLRDTIKPEYTFPLIRVAVCTPWPIQYFTSVSGCDNAKNFQPLAVSAFSFGRLIAAPVFGYFVGEASTSTVGVKSR